MSVVCGTDFSRKSAEAELVAAAFAERLRTDLKLVHVIDVRGRSSIPPELPQVFGQVEDLISARARTLEKDYGIDVAGVALEGTADERMASFALESRASLVVVASSDARERDGFASAGLGERLTQRSKFPVLVVRDASRIHAWLQGKRRLRVMLGVDMGAASRAALCWAQDLRKIAPCDLEIVQVVWPAVEHSRYGIPGPILLEGMNPELESLLQRDLGSWVGPARGDGEMSLVVRPGWGRCDAQLCSLASSTLPDLIVVGTRQKSWIARIWEGSVSRGILRGAETNVACAPRAVVGEALTSVARFRRVLIPTDFSELANRAIASGYGLLQPGGEAHLLHVQLPEAGHPPLNELENRLRALIPVDGAALGIDSQVHVVTAPEACVAIVRLAERLGVDAICMSTRGRSGASALVLGSQAREVLWTARQPVLLVKTERE